MAVPPPPPPHGTILSVAIQQTITKQYFSDFIMLRNIQWRVIVRVENRGA